MPRPKPPCKDYPDRDEHCHGKCEKYIEYKEESQKNKEEFHKSLIYDKYFSNMIKRQRKKR